MKRTYYSALDKEDTAEYYPLVLETQYKGNLAFSADASKWDEIKDLFEPCDLLYTEMPWPAGYKKFYSQAAVKAPDSYEYLISIVNRIIKDNRSNKALAFVVGKSFMSKFEKYDFCNEVKLHGYPAMALLYNISPIGLNFKDNYSLIQSLAMQFNCVGDFMAGYGNTGQIFAEQGKNFVLSELNPRCIGYIAQHIKNWVK